MGKYTIPVEQDKDGVLKGSAVESPGRHNQANTDDKLFFRMKEAIELYRKVQGKRKSWFNPNASRRNNQ